MQAASHVPVCGQTCHVALPIVLLANGPIRESLRERETETQERERDVDKLDPTSDDDLACANSFVLARGVVRVDLYLWFSR